MSARVYWHGVFPDINTQGIIVRRGTIRHEVLWDGKDRVALVPLAALKLVSAWRKCDCGRCGKQPPTGTQEKGQQS